MYYRTIRNDILKNKAISLTTIIFVAAAAMLVSLAAILVVNLTGAIDTLMTRAKTPHFMQMHSGEIDMPNLSAFVAENEYIDEFQVLEFLNIDGVQIDFQENSLADSVQDNGFSIQSEKFDYLLDLNGNIITVSDGELYVPLCYMQDGTTKVGDKVRVSGKNFVVAGFLRDSQMNSLLASSKRFLVSENDYKELKELGSVEYLIEFRLKDLSTLNAFGTAYTTAGLEANGPTITYPLFKTINALSDGMMIAVILLVSILVVAIAFLCIRFTLLAKIEDDYREIGVMKAIGLRVSDIKKIYLSKYAVIAVGGCVLGFLLSFVFRDKLLENIRLFMGESENNSIAFVFGMISVLFVFLTIIFYVNSVLNRFRKISPAEAIRFGVSQEKNTGGKRFYLSNNRLLNTNIFLGIKDVLGRKKLYATTFAVLVILVFIIIVPQNLYNTISSKDFVSYMGIGQCDMRIDIQQTDNISGKTAEISQVLTNDSLISKFVVLTTKTFKVNMDDGSEESIKIELGDHSIFPVKYSAGRAPVTKDEIALSGMNAEALGKKVGDIIKLMIEGKEQALTVCGIYSDVTNGGKTAKAVFTDDSADTMWSIINSELVDKSLIEPTTKQYADRFDFAKVSGIDAYVIQTYGATISSIGKASYAAIAVALVIAILITVLFMKLLVAKDRYSIAVMKAFGFTSYEIKSQYVSRSVFVLLVAIILGTILANTLGAVVAGAVISSFGASSFEFVINPFLSYVIFPLMMVITVLIATIIGTLDVERIKISENIKE
ncbi:MAG: ABC transporter permease [Anaerolineaceae bacterium]|nr:ABC transporter permease [Anaerolineaceae bacterium]